VRADAERQVLLLPAADIEAVGVGKAPVVPVGRSEQETHDAALGNGLAVQFDIPRDVPAGLQRRRLEAQDLVDRVRDAPPAEIRCGLYPC
jgi:hypothetical protein